MSQSTGSTGQRRKTTEACNPCRARKLKCNGMLPCESCERNKVKCSYDPSTSASRLTGDLDIINARVMELERAVFGERTYQPRRTVELADAPQITNETVSGVTFVDEKTGVADYFGSTSTIDLLKSFHETVQEVLDHAPSSGADERASKRQRREAVEHPINSDASRNFRIQDIYASPTVRRATSWWPSGNLVEVHLDYFFGIVYSTIPIFDENVFRAAFRRFANTSESSQRLQWECLTYSILALGALYSPSDTECAASYFAEAQGLLGSLLGVSALRTAQAALLMAVYAHYTAQHNLAYDYLGIAIRLAYSAGLNRNFDEIGFTNIVVQEARRTWWTLYSLESELCVEYGRPLCIRETDSIASYPQETLDETATVSRVSFIIVMAKFSRTVRKIIDLVSNIDEKRNGIKSFAGRLMNLQAELMTWRGELPAHLAPKDIATSEGLRARERIAWVQRQCCDIELRE
ncbi:hypothetical protein N7499_011653 [Penicillium canescens]|nr:hypothetical protein N7499_011653 [Penicillium canescens]KAJ6182182.1 hypothetical protein N7485_000824 [Penicillium canescens]